MKLYCINLLDRYSKWETAKQMFENGGLTVERFNAIDCRPNGMAGAFKSHLAVLRNHLTNHGSEDALIFEDDCCISSDFSDRLELYKKELPADFDIFMLGHWPMPNAGFSHVLNSPHIKKAKQGFLGAHCYLVNSLSVYKLINIFEALSKEDMDRIFNVFADKLNTYIAFPAMAYQTGNFSDTSNSPVNYEGTKTYFSDKL